MSGVLHLVGRDFDGFRRSVAAHADAWTEGTVDATWLGLPELQATVLGGDAPADLLVVPADWLPSLAAAGRIVPLGGYVDARPPAGWPDAWSPSFRDGVSWGGEIWGLPFHDGPQLLFSRTDLLVAGSLARPRTWTELVEVARALHGGDVAGTVLAGAPDGHSNVYDFVLHLWRFGGDVLTEGRVTLDSPAAHDALAFLRELATTLVSDGAHGLDSNRSGAEFAAGRVGVAVNWAGYAALATDTGVAFDCGVVPAHDDGTPTTTVNAFWVATVASGCADTDLAWDYLVHAASPEMDLATTRCGASGARRSTWSDPAVLRDRPEYALFDAAHAHSRPLPRVPELPAVVEVLNELVDAVVWRGEPVVERLGTAHEALVRLTSAEVAR